MRTRLSSCLLLVGLLAPATSFAGITPPYLTNDSLLAGTTWVGTINATRSTTNGDAFVPVTITAPCADWITVTGNTIPDGKHFTPIQFTVTVPADAPLGVCSGNIRFGGPAAALASLSLRVTDVGFADPEVRVTGRFQPEVYEARQTIRSCWTVRNNGNRTAHLTANLRVYRDVSYRTLLYTLTTDDVDEVPPFAFVRICARFANTLPPSPYVFYPGIGRVQAFYGGRVRLAHEGVEFGSTSQDNFQVRDGANAAPVADAGPDQIVATDDSCTARVTLDGRASSDGDSSAGSNDDIIEYAWSLDGAPIGVGDQLEHVFDEGEFAVTLTVTDVFRARASDVVQVTVVPNDTCGDACPDDPAKDAPGVCGCGTPDVDADNDGALVCEEACDEDPAKTEPGICGCGVADDDSDGDGTADCDDRCPLDPAKVEPGACDCGTPDTDTDSDGSPDCVDEDDDDDGVEDAADAAPLDPTVCRDADGDTCDDCSAGADAPGNDGLDTDSDGLCDAGDPDDDNDTVPDADDGAPLDPNACRDLDGDACDDCVGGAPDPSNDGLDTDSDGLCDAGDPDDDNDTVPDVDDGAPLDPNACRDVDGDTCDDCGSGADAPGNDGLDTDSDGLCDAGDPDDDGDGAADDTDNCPLTANPDQRDHDADGAGDLCDPDDDNDGVADEDDPYPASDITPTVTIGGCDSGVDNALDAGTSLGDQVGECLSAAANHGQQQRCLAHLAKSWRDAGLIRTNEQGAIQRCGAR